MRTTAPPSDIREAIPVLLDRGWGLRARLTALGGQSANFRVEGEAGRRFVLKLLHSDEPDALSDLEAAMAEHVAAALPDLRLPRFVQNRNGALVTTEGPVRARLLEWVDGTAWGDVLPASAERFRHCGQTVARIGHALDGFTHPAAERTHAWDLTRADGHAGAIRHVPDVARRATLEYAFHLWRAAALPRMRDLPRGVIHGDLNDENVLVGDERVTGVLDFGDALENPLICELAIATAYALLDRDDPLDAAALIVAGHHEVRPLSPQELAVLFPLVVGRLAVSVAIAARRRTEVPDHPTWYVTEERAWRLLERLVGIAPNEAARKLAAMTTIDPVPEDGPVDMPALLARRRSVIGPSLSIAYREPLAMVRGEGAYLFDAGGRPFLDLVNNVCHVGHCHPHVVAAGQAQMARLNTNTRYLHEEVVRYAERLCATLPEPLRVCWFVNSGSEANELALRLAFAHTGRRDVAVVDGAYHGNTATLVALSPYKFMGRGGSGAAEPWVHVTPLPDGYRGMHRGHSRETGVAYGDEVGRVMNEASAPIAAFLAESLPSCGGQIVPPPGWLATAFEHARAAGAVCIIDEVQTGFGRVGDAFWGFERQGVVPDIVVLGKPIANGHPMGAVVTTPEIAASFDTGMEFFSTFGGNPVSGAIANAVLDVIESERLQERAFALGTRFLAGLHELVDRYPLAGEARGAGLFLGLELVRDRASREPAPQAASAVIEAVKGRGILLSTDGPAHNVLKIKPPLAVSEADADMALRALDDVLSGLRP